MPTTFREFEDYLRAMLEGDTLHVTAAARELAIEVVLHPPVPVAVRPLLELADTVTVGLLPATLRRQYGLSWDPLRGLAVRADRSTRGVSCSGPAAAAAPPAAGGP